jgi:hypothetical protein
MQSKQKNDFDMYSLCTLHLHFVFGERNKSFICINCLNV